MILQFIRKNFSSLLWLFLAISVAVAIFIFSSQPAAQSDDVSMRVLRKLLELCFGGTTEEMVRRYNHFIRKAAHFTIYALFGFCLIGVFQHRQRFSKLAYTVLVSSVFAASDEMHQFFVAGRGPRFTDVLIDTAGASVGALIMIGFLVIFERNSAGNAMNGCNTK